MQMLPDSGSICDMLDIMEIIKKIRVEQEEKDRVSYCESKGVVTWNVSADTGKEVEFKHEEISILKAAVKKIDEEKKVNMSNLDICLKINSL